MSEQHTLDELGREVAETLGDGPDDARLAAQERALLRHLETAPSRRKTALVPTVAAAAVVLLAVGAAVVLLPGGPEVLAFEVGPEQQAGTEGQWLTAGATQALPVVFPGDAQVDLGRGSSGRILEARPERVRVGLNSGRLAMRIVRKKVREWTVEAGPYRVTAVGTEFAVDWDADQAHFAVTVQSGKVRVQGQGLDPDGLLLGVGDRLQADHGKPVAEFAAVPAPDGPREPPAPASPDAVSSDEVAPSPGPSDSRVASLSRSRRRSDRRRPVAPLPVVPTDWRSLHARGEYVAALDAARAAGFARLLTQLDLAGLWELAETARFAKRGREAEQALRALRERFPGARRARLAAFLLGRVTMELHGRPGLAVTWFETYLSEDRQGPLAEEALGRLIDAARRSGRDAQARDAARRYLDRYPHGLFAELARSVRGD